MKNKILIVDDEPDILDILQYNLEKEGYLITKAKNGKEAIKKAYDVKPDLILLDIMMPKKNGIDVCRELREDQKFSGTYIMFLTARDEEYSEIAGFDVGADDYVVKPIRPRSLISRIKALMSKKRALENKEQILKFGDLVIDREKYLVYENNKVINLTKKQFKILLLLTSKPEKVFTRETIYSKVWGKDILVGERTLDVHIRKIREKLSKKYIFTIKGIGYSFKY